MLAISSGAKSRWLFRIVLRVAKIPGLDDKVTAVPVESRPVQHIISLVIVGVDLVEIGHQPIFVATDEKVRVLHVEKAGCHPLAGQEPLTDRSQKLPLIVLFREDVFVRSGVAVGHHFSPRSTRYERRDADSLPFHSQLLRQAYHDRSAISLRGPRLRKVLRRSNIAWRTASGVARDRIANQPEFSLQREDVMTSRPTLLAHLAYKLSPQPETVATEALGHILRGSESARAALQEFLLSAGADVGRINTVGTEVRGDGGERPDLACTDGDGRERVLIEVKFWAPLTENQPAAYLARLPDDRASALLVIAPSARLETLWPELRARAAELLTGTGSSVSETRWISVGDNRNLIMTSWSSFLTRLAGAIEDKQAVSDIRQLQGLAEQQDSEEFLPLRAEQLSSEVPRLILNLDRLVDEVSSRIFTTDWADRDRMQKRWEGGPFQYMTVAGFSAWFGVNYRFWKQYEITPLWFGFQDSAWEKEEQILRSLKPLRHKDPPQYFEEEGIIPIRLQTGIEYDKVVDDVVGQLADIGRLLLAARA